MKTLFFTKMPRDQRGAGTLKGVLILVAIVVLVPLLIVGFYEGRKAYWDRQVREMCAKDGGAVILDRITISPEQEGYLPHAGGVVSVAQESLSDPRAPAFANVREMVIRNGRPSVIRYEQEIVRRLDGRLVAKGVVYLRNSCNFRRDVQAPYD